MAQALLHAISEAPDMSGGTDEAVQHIEKLLEQCPQVTGGAVDMLQAWCEDPAKVKKGMTLLKQLIVQCPMIRDKTLEVLLSFTHHAEAYVREPAVRLTTNSLFEPEGAGSSKGSDSAAKTPSECGRVCTDIIRRYASACFLTLKQGEEGETDGTYTFQPLPEGGPTEEDAKQRMELYLALCTKDPSLLQRSLDVFVQSNTPTKRMINLLSARGVWAAIGGESTELQKLLSTFPVPNGFPYIQAMLSKLSQGTAPDSLVKTVKRVYAERAEVNKDVRLLT